MSEIRCSIEACGRAHYVRGFCRPHYQKALREEEIAVLRPKLHRLTAVDAEARTATCSTCGPTRIRVRKNGKAHECMTVRKANQRSKKPLSRAAIRKKHLRDKYKLSVADYDRMYAAVDGCCEICSQPAEMLSVDHDHDSGVVRGLLCHRCNIGLGFFADNPDRMLAAVRYLTDR